MDLDLTKLIICYASQLVNHLICPRFNLQHDSAACQIIVAGSSSARVV